MCAGARLFTTLQIAFIDCLRGEKEIPRGFISACIVSRRPQSRYQFQCRGLTVNDEERRACVCTCEVDGVWSCKAPIFTQHKHLSNLTNTSLRSPRTPKHQTLKQQQLDLCTGSTCGTCRRDWRRPRRRVWLRGAINHLHAAQLSGSCRVAATKTHKAQSILYLQRKWKVIYEIY